LIIKTLSKTVKEITAPSIRVLLKRSNSAGIISTNPKKVQKKNLLPPLKTLTDQPNTRSLYFTIEENSAYFENY